MGMLATIINSLALQAVLVDAEDGKRAVRTPIQIARQNPTQFEVAEGLKPGDRIVVSGYSAFGEAEEINF